MINWTELTELYEASQSPNSRAQQTAQRAIEANIGAWIEEFLTQPDSKDDKAHRPLNTPYIEVKTFDDLSRWPSFFLEQNEGENRDDFWVRSSRLADKMKTDKLGCLLRVYLRDKAAAESKSGGSIRIFGDQFSLALTPGDMLEPAESRT